MNNNIFDINAKKLEDSSIRYDSIKKLIYTIMGKQVMLDSDLAILYRVETRVLNQAVKRNIRIYVSTCKKRYRFGEITKYDFTRK